MLYVLHKLTGLLCGLELFLPFLVLPVLQTVCVLTTLCCVCHSGSPSLRVSAALNCVVTVSGVMITYSNIKVPLSGCSQAMYLFTPDYLR